MPTIIAKKNKITPEPPKPNAAMEGPGHNPANAHPMPNNTDPVTNGTSILLLVGIEKFKSNNGVFFAVMTQATLMGIMAPAITKAKVGSQ
jgi:hypothetical protein